MKGRTSARSISAGQESVTGPSGRGTGIKLIKRSTEINIAQDGFLSELIVKSGVE